ncbi:MAG: DEAD/DEAH box helicase [Bifidobacteriaceae bacterium]|nr:DEAD/DEAH box helicase [Bifidobacteriaceae bacterium]
MNVDGDRALRELTRERDGLRAEVARLRRLLGMRGETAPGPERMALALARPGQVTRESPPHAKAEFFARRFAARTDVYARYWQNDRTGEKGWLPTVRGQWRKGVPVRQQNLMPLTLDAIASHLRGDDFFMGLYPLLDDSTCHWLAADFDGLTAMQDALAYIKAARKADIPAALEVSQSGRGAHVWVFFSAPVPARDARAVGTALIREAITLTGTMSLGSYDRLFPNQDSPPRDGIGNLIAAPLNGRRARERGTTLFLDLETLEPHDDQWAYLSNFPSMSPGEVARLAKAGQVLTGSDLKRVRRTAATRIHPPLPTPIRATLGAVLTVNGEDLTPEFAAALRHAAAIHNPEFYRRQRQRRTVRGIPRFIEGYDLTLDGAMVLPRGLAARVGELAAQAGSRLEAVDARNDGAPLRGAFSGELRAAQADAVSAMLEHENGILIAPPGAGKTVMALAIAAERGVSTLVLLEKRALAEQWRNQIDAFLGVKAGQLGGGRKKLRGGIDIMISRTLERRDDIAELTKGYGQVIVDECHHVAAAGFEAAVKQIAAPYWLGLTATLERPDGLHPLVAWQLGPVRHRFDEKPTCEPTLESPEPSARRRLTIRDTDFTSRVDSERRDAWTEIQREIVADDARNRLIITNVAEALARGRRCVLLVRWVDHLRTMAELARESGVDPLILRGATTPAELRDSAKRLAAVPDGEPILVIGTIPFMGEGFDAPILDTVFLGAPVAFPGYLKQCVGRVLRKHSAKTVIEAHDYADPNVPILAAMLRKRLPGYRQLGFTSNR